MLLSAVLPLQPPPPHRLPQQIPDGVNVGKDARAAFSVSARIFVSYLTAT